MARFDSILLIAFGGPEKPDDVRPFLRIVTAGRSIPDQRIEEVAHHYEVIGGRSPLNELTFRQAAALRDALAAAGWSLPVFVGMRSWHPFLAETLDAMQASGRRRALGIILSSFQTEASWERYQADVASARATVGRRAPEVHYAPSWSDHPGFTEAMADRARQALGRVAADDRARTPLVFTAHSVPAAMAERSPYVTQFEGAARAVAGRLGHGRWTIAYQSRSGSPGDPWLEPDVGEVIRTLAAEGARDVVVVPIGFVCDHVEVRFDLDVKARALAAELGVRLHRAEAANDHPAFVQMLVDLVRRGRTT
jgi:ferrochelatase